MTDDVRSWGFWTSAKLGILESYLSAFLTAGSRRVNEFVYLDGFAGQAIGVDRHTGASFPGSAELALQAVAQDQVTRFTHLHYFELPAKAPALRARLTAQAPDRNITVHAGDVNVQIATALAELRHVRWAPTFAFLDPDGMSLSWETLDRLAAHKSNQYKVELWLLFPTQGVIRALALDETRLHDSHAETATRLFGTTAWRSILERRRCGDLTPNQAREAYVNLMRWQLENDLEYRWTHPFEVKNTKGVPIYHMIFATDNDAGNRIMSHIYQRAQEKFPEMQREALDATKQQTTLDLGLEPTQVVSYEYIPPRDPTDRGG